MTQAGSADGWIVDRYSIPDSSGRNYGFFYELETVVWRIIASLVKEYHRRYFQSSSDGIFSVENTV